MVVAGGWRCVLNINVASPRLAGSIGMMVGGKWICQSERSVIPLPKATERTEESTQTGLFVYPISRCCVLCINFSAECLTSLIWRASNYHMTSICQSKKCIQFDQTTPSTKRLGNLAMTHAGSRNGRLSYPLCNSDGEWNPWEVLQCSYWLFWLQLLQQWRPT